MTTTLAPTDTLALLRNALRLDAVVTGLNGAAYVAGAALLDGVLGVPSGWLAGIGVFLLAFAGFVAIVGARPDPDRRAAGVVVEANVVWVLASLAVAVTDPFGATTTGTVWTVLQAGTVAAFAALQYAGLRRSR